jgi:hypothetical protein
MDSLSVEEAQEQVKQMAYLNTQLFKDTMAKLRKRKAEETAATRRAAKEAKKAQETKGAKEAKDDIEQGAPAEGGLHGWGFQ